MLTCWVLTLFFFVLFAVETCRSISWPDARNFEAFRSPEGKCSPFFSLIFNKSCTCKLANCMVCFWHHFLKISLSLTFVILYVITGGKDSSRTRWRRRRTHQINHFPSNPLCQLPFVPAGANLCMDFSNPLELLAVAEFKRLCETDWWRWRRWWRIWYTRPVKYHGEGTYHTIFFLPFSISISFCGLYVLNHQL
jgi:hypothetical protein